jgi:hypothetical protein
MSNIKETVRPQKEVSPKSQIEAILLSTRRRVSVGDETAAEQDKRREQIMNDPVFKSILDLTAGFARVGVNYEGIPSVKVTYAFASDNVPDVLFFRDIGRDIIMLSFYGSDEKKAEMVEEMTKRFGDPNPGISVTSTEKSGRVFHPYVWGQNIDFSEMQKRIDVAKIQLTPHGP